MSFLQDLQRRKAELQSADTIVTSLDGTRFVEKHGSAIAKLGRTCCGYVVDTWPDEKPALIVPDLYLGSQDSCTSHVVNHLAIGTVLSVGITAPFAFPHVDHHFVECLDLPDTDLSAVISRCNAVIRKALASGSSVLVHCNAGVSRSASVVIGYLMLERGYTYDQAATVVKLARPCVRPNDGFVRQLTSLA